MTETMDFLRGYGSVLAMLGTVAIALLATRFVTRLDHEKAVSSLDAKFVMAMEKINKSEERIARLESDFRHLPDRDSVHRIELSLSALKGELKAVGEQLKPVAAISERLQEFLLEQARK